MGIGGIGKQTYDPYQAGLFQYDRPGSRPKGVSGYFGSGSEQKINENARRGSQKSEQIRELLRELKKTEKSDANRFTSFSQDRENGIWGSAESSDDDKDKPKVSTSYNYKEVETKIRQAKTSVSAGAAVIAAKRKVLEVKRKLAAAGGDDNELAIALNHAKRMEMAARKKKHHLELEELVENTGKRDELLDKMKEQADSLKSSVYMAEEEKLSAREDEIFKARDEMIEEAEQMRSRPKELDSEEGMEEAMEEMYLMISEFGEEQLRELEDAMELLETMEIVDPHMSREKLAELKQKHRSSEEKAMMKADMDYIKGMIRNTQAAGTGMSASFGSQTAAFGLSADIGSFAADPPAVAIDSMV